MAEEIQIMNDNSCEFWLSDAVEDPAWDEFVEATPGGHHVQTSRWARVKAVLGWEAVRVVVMAGDAIVGGGQMLWRRVPVFGAVGYVPKGPVLSVDDAGLRSDVIAALLRVARSLKVRHLTVQPANNGHNFIPSLVEQGFHRSSVPVAPAASSILDLRPPTDSIRAQLSRKTRYNIGLGGRKGITIREGSDADLDGYWTMLAATGDRQGFSVFPKEYFVEMWRCLHPDGHLKLFVAEDDGEVVAGQLIVPFADTVVNKLSVWSGRHGSKRPNELLQWNAIEWSKANGYDFYDFEGIDPIAVEALHRNEPLPESLKQTVTSFKLGFGGEPTQFPGAWYHVQNAVVGFTYETVFPKVSHWPIMQRAVALVRMGWGSGGRD